MKKAIVSLSSEDMYTIDRVEVVTFLKGTLTILYTDSNGQTQTSIYTQESLNNGTITII